MGRHPKPVTIADILPYRNLGIQKDKVTGARTFHGGYKSVDAEPYEGHGFIVMAATEETILNAQVGLFAFSSTSLALSKFNGLEANRNDMAFNAGYSLDGPQKAMASAT